MVLVTHTALRQLFLMAMALPAWMAWHTGVFYLAGTIILIIGLVTATRIAPPQANFLDRFIGLAPTFLAIPMAVFGVFHFVEAAAVATVVPRWIPGHFFWTYFVGACLIAGALSLAANKYAGVAAGLFGIMLLLFELLIHIPGLVRHPHERILWATALRDLAFSGGGLALAATMFYGLGPQGRRRLATLARLFITVPILFFAVEHFLHPELAPGVPLDKVTPLWIPGRLLWSYVTGSVFVVAGICLLINKGTRLAASAVGLMIFLVCLAVYVPIVIAIPADIANGLNYLVDTLLMSGSALALAGTAPSKAMSRAS